MQHVMSGDTRLSSDSGDSATPRRRRPRFFGDPLWGEPQVVTRYPKRIGSKKGLAIELARAPSPAHRTTRSHPHGVYKPNRHAQLEQPFVRLEAPLAALCLREWVWGRLFSLVVILQGHPLPRPSAGPCAFPSVRIGALYHNDTCSRSPTHRRSRLLCMGGYAQCQGRCPTVRTQPETRGSGVPHNGRRAARHRNIQWSTRFPGLRSNETKPCDRASLLETPCIAWWAISWFVFSIVASRFPSIGQRVGTRPCRWPWRSFCR